MRILSIDPGPVQSAYVIWDGEEIISKNIVENNKFLGFLKTYPKYNGSLLVIEKVECFGMPVGKSIFDTVFWSGRFCEAIFSNGWSFFRVGRKDVKMHLCGNMRAKDSNITQALIDRFAPYERNKGKGTKKNPGFFYGFKSDIWQAFALAVTFLDQEPS